MRRQAVFVIPAFEPTRALEDLIAELTAACERPIVVVNDGSSARCDALFERLRAHRTVTVLVHAANLGKGQALKTAFNHLLVQLPADTVGAVTADADGQHRARDVLQMADRLEAEPTTLVLGSRHFDERVPVVNRVGNIVTRGVFRVIVGRKLTDTQTGLRAIPRSFLRTLLTIEAAGYEFELEMLVRATRLGVPIAERPIETIYGMPAASHFNPLRDSLRIYFVFTRFIALSLVTAAIDYSVFALVFAPARNILLATIAARAIAGLFNFTVGRSLVFRSRASVAPQAVKYALLVTALMWISYGLVTTFVLVLGLGVYVSKLLAESALFAASFALQNVAVFGEPRRGARTARRATDWDAYYRRPALFAPLTRRITQRVVVREIVAALGGREPSAILELGGGNSPLLLALHARYPRAHLAAVDTNAVGLDLLAVQLPHKGAIDLVHRSVLAPATAAAADVVYSIGLIEHFDPADTARAVAAHFDYARPGGIVLMTFPMPTWLYRAVRAAAEALGIWRFPDERPLAIDEVTQEALRHGDLVRCFVNWPIVLTQGVLVLRKRGQAN